MNYKSVTEKNWLLNKYDENYAKKIYETFHFSEILSKIISIRKIEFDLIQLKKTFRILIQLKTWTLLQTQLFRIYKKKI